MGTYTKEQLTDELNRIKTATSACRDAIYNKGVISIPADASLGSLAAYASMITSDHPDILLEYIANGPDSDSTRKNVYFDTGFVPTQNTRIECRTSIHYLSDENRIFGNVYDSNWSGIRCFPGYSPGLLGGRMGSKDVYCGSINADEIYTISIYGNYGAEMLVNETKTNAGSYSWETNDITAYIFAEHHYSDGARTSFSGVKMYYFKIWDSNNLVRFYVPVLHYYNGQYVACFYDKVNDNYIYNLGSGTVTYSSTGDYLLDYLGPSEETVVPVTEYSHLRYETGIVADTTIQIDTKFRLLWGGENYIYGSATDNTTTPTWQTFGVGYPSNLTTLRANFAAADTANRYTNMTDVGLLAPCRTSMYFENNYGRCYLNDYLFSQEGDSTKFSLQTIHIFSRHGNSQNVPVRNGARLYYCMISKSRIVQRSYVPVLHNGSPYLLDLNNGTYNSPVAPGINVTYSILE